MGLLAQCLSPPAELCISAGQTASPGPAPECRENDWLEAKGSKDQDLYNM